jgi:hypothetical protein
MTTQAEGRVAWRPSDTLAARLLLLRRELRLSQREAAMKTGVSFGVWQGMEDGRATRGIDRAVASIAATLGVDRDWLMWGGALGSGPGGGVTATKSGWSPDSALVVDTWGGLACPAALVA